MENAAFSKKDSSGDKESDKPKKRRQPEDLGALAVVSEREELKTLRQRFEKPSASGHVGAAALLAEAKPVAEKAKPTKVPAERAPQITESPAAKNMETISRTELLSLSEKVLIDGSSLRQIYETHLVGEHGLRRLMAEHLRDGDLKKALRREIVERQIDFERDPDVRDLTVPLQSGTGTRDDDSGKAALNELLKQTDLAAEDRGEEAAFFKARALYEADQLQQHKQRRRIIDVTVGALIVILLALVTALYMGRY